MDTLTSMRAFVHVAELASFSAAARRMQLSPAMVTKHIAHLEARVGATLLLRTTRKVTLTQAGAAYHLQCQEVLRLVADAEEGLGRQADEPVGTLRVTAPVELGNRHVAPLAAALLQAHPDLAIEFQFTNRVVDLAEEGVDVAVRVAPALDSGLPGRRIATSRLLPVASPAYLARHGMPVDPQDLSSHPALIFGIGDWRHWNAVRHPHSTAVKMCPRLRSSASETLREAALGDAGVSLLPTFLVGEDLRAGRLVPLLTDWDFGRLGIHLLYPQRRHRPARLRVFVEALTARLGTDPQADPFWPPVAPDGGA